MDFTKIDPDVLRALLKLTESRAELMTQVAAIDRQISDLSTGKTSATAPTGAQRGRKPGPTKGAKRGPKPGAKRGPKPGAKRGPKPKADKAPAAAKAPKAAKADKPVAKRGPGKGAKRGAMKEQITGLLGKAGPEGMAVKDIAQKLGMKNQNVHVWFSTTGKKVEGLSKVGEARYALGKSSAPKASASTPAPAAAAPASTPDSAPSSASEQQESAAPAPTEHQASFA